MFNAVPGMTCFLEPDNLRSLFDEKDLGFLGIIAGGLGAFEKRLNTRLQLKGCRNLVQCAPQSDSAMSAECFRSHLGQVKEQAFTRSFDQISKCAEL